MLRKLGGKQNIRVSDLATKVIFYKYTDHDGPEPGEKEEKKLYESWAKVDEVWMKDLELAKYNQTESDLTIMIRDPRNEYMPTNKHYLEIDRPEFKDERYNIKQVYPDFRNNKYIKIVAGFE